MSKECPFSAEELERFDHEIALIDRALEDPSLLSKINLSGSPTWTETQRSLPTRKPYRLKPIRDTNGRIVDLSPAVREAQKAYVSPRDHARTFIGVVRAMVANKQPLSRKDLSALKRAQETLQEFSHGQ